MPRDRKTSTKGKKAAARRPLNGSSTWPKFALCLNNQSYAFSLEVRKVYTVLPDAEAAVHGLLRVVDESGEDYLYPNERFAMLDLSPSLRKKLASTRS
jgi:hypothetical protein